MSVHLPVLCTSLPSCEPLQSLSSPCRHLNLHSLFPVPVKHLNLLSAVLGHWGISDPKEACVNLRAAAAEYIAMTLFVIIGPCLEGLEDSDGMADHCQEHS